MNKVCLYISLVLLFLSCAKEETLTSETSSDDLIVNNISTTAFSATISGTFKGISKVDIALGKNGVFYCPKSEEAESVFQSWVDGDDNPDCSVLVSKSDLSKESFNETITDLYPETEYVFCLFSQRKDGKRRISSPATFVTGCFKPEFKELRIEDIHYIDFAARSSVIIDDKDVSSCKRGVLVTYTAGGDINDAVVDKEITGSYDNDNPSFRITINGIKPDTSYYCRTYVKYIDKCGVEKYVFGPEKNFSALRSENMYVDLGLTSGIKWANCDLGEWVFNADFYKDDYFCRWGSLQLTARHDRSGVKTYEYWDAAINNYIDIGTDISGTDYDIAHTMLGGKWRLPRREDVKELIDNCNTKNIVELSALVWVREWDKMENSTIYAGHIIGPNNSEFMLPELFPFWTGSLCDDSEHAYVFDYMAVQWISSDIKVNKGEIRIREEKRVFPCKVRPVWDPNM